MVVNELIISVQVVNNNSSNSKYAIEERRRQVANLLARSMTESEIAEKLGVSQQTISLDVKALKEMSLQFIFDLAKSDLTYYYKSCIDGIELAKKEAWGIVDKYANSGSYDPQKIRLAALKVIISAEAEKFKLLNEGPVVLGMKVLEDRLEAASARNNLPDKLQKKLLPAAPPPPPPLTEEQKRQLQQESREKYAWAQSNQRGELGPIGSDPPQSWLDGYRAKKQQ
jgi:transcriptional regulator with XRE-family HTH domain